MDVILTEISSEVVVVCDVGMKAFGEDVCEQLIWRMSCWCETSALSQPFLGVFGDLCVGVVMLPYEFVEVDPFGSECSDHVSEVALWCSRLVDDAIVLD